MTLNAYLQSIPQQRRQRFDTLMQLIVDAYLDATVDMQYRMPTFHNADKGWCALANQKHYISLYTCGPKNISDFKTKHPQIKCGKGCINLTDTVELPLADLKLVIDNAMHASEQCRMEEGS
ncbi:MAG: iron chaperone [Phycisphaeraceae bacterium JB051]